MLCFTNSMCIEMLQMPDRKVKSLLDCLTQFRDRASSAVSCITSMVKDQPAGLKLQKIPSHSLNSKRSAEKSAADLEPCKQSKLLDCVPVYQQPRRPEVPSLEKENRHTVPGDELESEEPVQGSEAAERLTSEQKASTCCRTGL